MEQIINQTLNINVNNATPAVPNTGFVTSSTGLVGHLGVIGCSVLFAIILGFAVIAVILLLQYKRHQQKSSLFLGTGLLAVSFGLFVPSLAMTSTGISGDTPETLETNIDIVTTPEGQVATGDTTITLANDMPDGFAIYAYMENDNALYNADGSAKIDATALTSSADPSSLTLNSYGILNSNKQYAPIAVGDEQAQAVYVTGTESPAGTNINLTFAAKLDDSVPTGTYTGHIVFGVMPTIFIQDVTDEVCQTFEMDKQIPVFDKRDFNKYYIAHLQDDRCWMTENLRLGDRDQSILLTPELSNVSTDFTLPASSSDWEADSLNVPQILIDPGTDTDSALWRPEVFYNWNAATAGTGDESAFRSVGNSICPKGWQLPQYAEDGKASVLSDNDYFNMLKYYLPYEEWNGWGWYDENGRVFDEPTKFNLPGIVYLEGSPVNSLMGAFIREAGSMGLWWFNTAGDAPIDNTTNEAMWIPNAYTLRVGYIEKDAQSLPTGVQPVESYHNRTEGASIRCVTQRPIGR